MTKFNAAILSFVILLNACATSQTSATASPIPISSSELTGSYECFAINGANNTDLGVLTLHADQTGTFGPNAFQWSYDVSINTITFDGDGTVRDALYFADGQSLSVNDNSDDHFTCVKSE